MKSQQMSLLDIDARLPDPDFPPGTVVRYGGAIARVVQGMTQGPDGLIPFKNKNVVFIRHKLAGRLWTTQAPKSKVIKVN